MSKYQINRNLEKLLQNDILIYKTCQSVLGSMNIKEYSESTVYQYGDLVWFLLRDRQGKVDSLWMLRCIEDNNSKPPATVKLQNGQLDSDKLSESGWKDENKYIDLINMGVINALKQYVNDRMVSHTSSSLHRFERLNAQNMQQKVLKSDISNLSSARRHYMFPYETRFMPQTNSVMYGYARRYENGILEYDIIFRLGFNGVQTIDGVERSVLKANFQQINNTNSLSESNPGWTGNERYFQSSQDYDIFKKQYNGQATVGKTIQINRGKYVNIYSANIGFIEDGQFRFADNKYMVFCSDVMSQDCNTDEQTINPSANTIIFINKCSNSITAMYITQPKNGIVDPSKNGLVSNTYHCKLIGKSYL